MPSFETARRIASVKNNGAKTIGQIHKGESDWLMEETFWNDPQSKVCYIYDYFHDDFITKYKEDGITPLYRYTLKDHMTYENTNKTQIDAKFIVKTYQSIDKDQVEYYLQFRPSQKTEFSENDELYYFETDYRNKYRNDDFIGLYVDIPDDRGVYRKWMICSKEQANQFVKYLILPCSYELTWVERDGQDKNLRRMWCVLRNQNSYTIGQYTDRYFTRPDNQQKLWLPLNSITEKLWYNDNDNKTMRLVVSALTEHPIVWAVTKIENVQPLGIQKLTIYQKAWDKHRDVVLKDEETGEFIGMFADYYDSNIEPTDPDTPTPTPSTTYGKITASTSTIKVGGSYKTLTLKLYDADDNEVTDNYYSATFDWSCYIKGDETDDLSDKVTWLNGSSFNQKKIKFADDRSYLDKILVIKCVVDDVVTIEEFELIG